MDNLKEIIDDALLRAKIQVISNNQVTTTTKGSMFGNTTVQKEPSMTVNNADSVEAKFESVMAVLYKQLMPSIKTAATNVESEKTRMTKQSKELHDVGTEIKLHVQDMELAEIAERKEMFDNVKGRYDRIKREYEMTCERVGRQIPVVKFKSAFAYYALLLFIGIAEIPLNLVIFQAFGESDATTMVMAGTLGIAVPVLAHFIGMFLRQYSEKKSYLMWGIGLLVLFLVTNTGLGVFRANELAHVIEASGGEVTEEGLYVNLLIFIGITTILFFIGVVSAYFRHDSSYSLEHTYYHFLRLRKRFEALVEVRKADYPAMLSKYEDAIDHIFVDNPRDRKIEYNNAVIDYNKLLGTARGWELYIQANYKSVASEVGQEVRTLPKPFHDQKDFLTVNYK